MVHSRRTPNAAHIPMMTSPLPCATSRLSQACEGEAGEQKGNGLDQHRRVLMNGDDLAFVGQEIPIDLGWDVVSVGRRPHPST